MEAIVHPPSLWQLYIQKARPPSRLASVLCVESRGRFRFQFHVDHKFSSSASMIIFNKVIQCLQWVGLRSSSHVMVDCKRQHCLQLSDSSNQAPNYPDVAEDQIAARD